MRNIQTSIAIADKELEFLFNESSFIVGGNNSVVKKGVIREKIGKESDSQAIVEYDTSNPFFSFWYAKYLENNSFDKSRVKKILLIGCIDETLCDEIKTLYPDTEISVLPKSIEEIELEDIYIQENLVFHSFGSILLNQHNDKIINGEFITVDRNQTIENLAKKIRATRYFFNVFLGLLQNDNDWILSEFKKVLDNDTVLDSTQYESKDFFIGANTILSSLKWYEDVKPKYGPKIFFDDDTRFPSDHFLYYTNPLKDTKYVSQLSHEPLPEFHRIYDFLAPEYQGDVSPYGIVADCRILHFESLYKSNQELCFQLIDIYKQAALEGVYEAYNCIGVFYAMIGDRKNARIFFSKAYDHNVEYAAINMRALAHKDNDSKDVEIWERNTLELNGIFSQWHKSLLLWKSGKKSDSLRLLELLLNSHQVLTNDYGLRQRVINNLSCIYLYGVPDSHIKPNIKKLQELFKLLNPEKDKEIIAVYLFEDIIYHESERNKSFIINNLISDLYKELPDSASHVYNMASCLAFSIGCARNSKKAIEICKAYLKDRHNVKLSNLLAVIFTKERLYQDALQTLRNIPNPDFIIKANIASILSEIDIEESIKLIEKYLNEPACETCYESSNYNEVLKICPKLQYKLALLLHNQNEQDRALEYCQKSYKQGFNGASKLLEVISDKFSKELFVHNVLYGNKRHFSILRLILSFSDKEQLHYMLLSENSRWSDDIHFQYSIYDLIHLISHDEWEELYWLKLSADNGSQEAIAKYAMYLYEQGDEYNALSYLEQYEGNEETIIDLRESLQERIPYPSPDNYYEEVSYARYYDNPEDSWLDAFDGDPDAYWNID